MRTERFDVVATAVDCIAPTAAAQKGTPLPSSDEMSAVVIDAVERPTSD
jgi:hypothetical protein